MITAVVMYGVDQGSDPGSLSWGYGLAVLTTSLLVSRTIISFIQLKNKKFVQSYSREQLIMKEPIHLSESHLSLMLNSDNAEGYQMGTVRRRENSIINFNQINDSEVDTASEIYLRSMSGNNKTFTAIYDAANESIPFIPNKDKDPPSVFHNKIINQHDSKSSTKGPSVSHRRKMILSKFGGHSLDLSSDSEREEDHAVPSGNHFLSSSLNPGSGIGSRFRTYSENEFLNQSTSMVCTKSVLDFNEHC